MPSTSPDHEGTLTPTLSQGERGSEPQRPQAACGLASLSVRLAVFAAMVLIALASIWLIDRRAMEIQHKHGWSPATGQLQQGSLPQP